MKKKLLDPVAMGKRSWDTRRKDPRKAKFVNETLPQLGLAARRKKHGSKNAG